MSTTNTTFIKSASQKKSLKSLNTRSYVGGAMSPIARSSFLDKDDFLTKKNTSKIKRDKSNNKSMVYDDTGKNSRS